MYVTDKNMFIYELIIAIYYLFTNILMNILYKYIYIYIYIYKYIHVLR